MAQTVRIRPYKDFLTPALHRRFMEAAAFLLLFCYAQAVCLGQFDSYFWSWFPLGRAGIRTGLLFICGFSIFVLRVAQLHLGIRTTNSPVSTFKEYALKYKTVQTALWYLFSGWLFAEIFIFSAPKDANIRWITDAKNNERPRLNERPIYLMSYFTVMALVQTGVHLYYDYDRIDLPVNKTPKAAEKPQEGDAAAPVIAERPTITPRLPNILAKSFQRSLLMTVVTPFIYSVFIRQTAWSYTLSFAKMLWNLPKSTALPSVSPFHWHILSRTLFGGTLLVAIWEVGNVAFSVYVAQPPLKKDMPITKDSKDENGSLLTGLNGKKLATRAFAFWELVLIADNFEARRKRIFTDIDRKGGSAWSQILRACMNTIEEMNKRVAARDPMASPTEAVPVAKDRTPQIVSLLKPEEAAPPQQPVQTLPRLTKDIPAENLWTNSPPPKTITDKFDRATIAFADKYGRSKDTLDVKRVFETAKTKVLTPEQEQMLTPQGIWALTYPVFSKVLKSPVGWLFQQTFRRRTAAIVLGKPYGDAGILVDATHAMCKFAVLSLKEDDYGHVSKDVPSIISLLTRSIAGLEQLRAGLASHWTDVGERSCEELDVVLDAMREGLGEVVRGFEPYFGDMKVSRGEVARAKEAVVRKEVREMTETRKRK